MNPAEYMKEKGWHIVNIITEDLQDNIHPYNNVSIEGCGPYLSDIHGITLVEDTYEITFEKVE